MATANLGATYYPSCVVNLKLRFDEAFSSVSSTPDGLSVDKQAASPPTAPAAPTGGLKIFAGTADTLSHVLARIPKTCSVELPAYRKAGQFSMSFDFRDLPIDPRMMRAMGVEIYMDSVAADDYANSILQVNPPGDSRGSKLTRQNRLSMLKMSPDNLVMQGIVDNWHVSHSGSGSEVRIEGRDLIGMFLNTPVTAAAIGDIELGRRIDDVIRDLITPMQGWAAGMDVRATPSFTWPKGDVPLVGKAITEQVATPRVRRAAIDDAIRLSAGADPDKLNFWDVITRWCYYVGAVPTITLSGAASNTTASNNYKVTLLIRPAQSLYDQWDATDDGNPYAIPFKGDRRRVVDGQSFAVRRMMFGRNIEELTLERKFTGRTLPKLVTVVSYNPSSDRSGEDRLITASYPPDVVEKATADNQQVYNENKARADAAREQAKAERKAAREAARAAAGKPPVKHRQTTTNGVAATRSRVAPSGEIAAQDQIRIPIPGLTTEDEAMNLASQIYNEICRGEVGGSCRTKSLSSFGAGNEDPDLVRLRPGDGMYITIDARQLQARAPSVSPLNEQLQKTPAELAADINKRIGDQNLSNAIAYTLMNALPKELTTYRVSNVKFDWNVSSGISVAFDFQNFIAVRNAVTPSPAGSGAPDPAGGATAVPAPK